MQLVRVCIKACVCAGYTWFVPLQRRRAAADKAEWQTHHSLHCTIQPFQPSHTRAKDLWLHTFVSLINIRKETCNESTKQYTVKHQQTFNIYICNQVELAALETIFALCRIHVIIIKNVCDMDSCLSLVLVDLINHVIYQVGRSFMHFTWRVEQHEAVAAAWAACS